MKENPTIASLQAKVRQLEELLDKRTKELSRELSDYVLIKSDLDKRTFELNQRINELKALLQISTISDLENLSLEDFFLYALKVITSSMQYPDITCAELKIGENVHQTDNFRETKWKLGRGVMDRTHMVGYLTVYYLEEKPDTDFGPFTKEEKNLLVVVTRYLGQVIKRKKIEVEKLREQKKYLELVESLPLEIAVFDKDGNIQFANEKTELLFNVQSGGLIGKNVQELVPKQTADHIVSLLRKVYETGKPVDHERVLESNGQKRFFKVNRLPIFNEVGEVINILVIGEDVTQQKTQEHQINILHQIDSLSNITGSVEDSLKLAFHYLTQIEWIDAGGVYLFDDDRLHLRLVYSAGLSEEFVNSVKEYSYKNRQVQAVLQSIPLYFSSKDYIKEYQPVLEAEKIRFVAGIPMIYREEVIGSINLASKTITQITDHDKRIVESIASRLANLIMLVKTREKLIISNEELKNTLDTISEKQQLLIQKSKLESLGELAAGLAHEINQPISVIALITENIAYRLKDDQVDKAYLHKKIGSIDLNIQKIKNLIDHVRVFSRDQGMLMFERVDVNQVIKNALSMLDAQLNYHRIHIKLNLHPDLGYTLGNPSRLEQVIFNLISNARDALDENEALVLMSVPVKEIHITTSARQNQLEIKIRDNGIGITPEHLDRIFNPFFTTKADSKGTGLGLSIVYGIISEMHGEIKIESELNKFTEATILLPRYYSKGR